MFCADSSSWVAYLSGSLGDDVEIIEAGLRDQSIRMAPMVISEILRDPLLPPAAEKSLLAIPMLDLVPGFWERAGKTRANLIKWKCKPKLADTLIAQVCIDHNMTLHARDTHF